MLLSAEDAGVFARGVVLREVFEDAARVVVGLDEGLGLAFCRPEASLATVSVVGALSLVSVSVSVTPVMASVTTFELVLAMVMPSIFRIASSPGSFCVRRRRWPGHQG